MLYQVCYIEKYKTFFGYTEKVIKEYPLSLEKCFLRQQYLKKFIKGYVWIERWNNDFSNI